MRKISTKRNDNRCPKGSVLGPALWNILYDELLNIQFEDDETKTIAHADDLALYVELNNINRLKQIEK